MVMPVYDKASRRVTYDGNVPRMVSLIQFAPRRVANEAATGLTAARMAEETDNAAIVGPEVYETQYASWNDSYIRLFPSVFVPGVSGIMRNAWVNGSPYLLMKDRINTRTHLSEGPSVYIYDPSLGQPEATGGLEVFDIRAYQAGYGRVGPFTQGVNMANARSNWLSNPAARDLFIPFVPFSKNGKVVASFDINEVYNRSVGDNVPFAPTGQPYTPVNDPNVGTGVWSDAVFETINGRFNKLWTDWNTLLPDLDRARFVKRFIDLRVIDQPDGSPGPLNPTLGYPRAYIVPGSEVVTGPDQRPGPNYGNLVRYSRVTQRPVGANQYFINYVNQREPDWATINLTPPGAYDPTNLVSAVIQPQFKVGYVEFNSAFGEPIPDGNIFVRYRFQFTEPNDIVALDYDSAQMIDVILTIRNYAQVPYPEPQAVTVKGSAKVRNFLR